MDNEKIVASALESAIPPSEEHIDEDTHEYISSILSEDPFDEDTREAVRELILSATEDNDQVDGVALCQSLFELLDLGKESGSGPDGKGENAEPELRMLGESVTMKKQDVQTFASGLRAKTDSGVELEESAIASFYANMIDPNASEAAISERDRRKARQKEMRIEMEEEERQRAIKEAMDMFQDNGEDDNESLMEKAQQDNMQDVHLKNFDLPNLRGGGPNLLQNASLTLARGRRFGLMGRNGCGKTTFLTFLAKRQIADAIPKNMNMLLVRQEIFGNELSAVETVLKSDVKRESVKRYIEWLEKELDKLDNPEKYAEEEKNDEGAAEAKTASEKKKESKGKQKLRDRKKQGAQQKAKKAVASVSKVKESKEERRKQLNLKLIQAHTRLGEIEAEEGGDPEPRARKVLAGLGFSVEMQDKPTQALSGGWRMRVSLSCALFASPALLLLDEPTNHLDLEAVLWLERYLTKDFKGTLVVVSHDRHFLNEVVTDVVHFHKDTLTTYRGDISNFEAVRADDKLRQERLREQQEAKRAHLQKYIDLHAQAGENGPKASRQRKSKMKKLDKLGVMSQDGKKWKASDGVDAEEVEEVEEEEDVTLIFPDPGSFDKDIIRLDQVNFGYSAEDVLLQNVDLTVNMKSRIALLGRNGCGKSTLIKLTVGGLEPLSGAVRIDPRAKIEYLAQHQLEQLDPDGTPLQTMVDRYPGNRSNTHIGELRRYLANFGLGGEILPNQKIHTMSGGQKCRLCLACAMYRKPHLLILDEPTNHLDLETTEALIEAIRGFNGGVLLVSHDQHLLTSVCDDLLVVEKRRLGILRDGNSNKDAFEAYKRAVVAGKR
ncbi:unnamed protein product [Cylindrotheca closterium]|uniref:ABC transporter domain-containing protein n=1 Tax=Cylindrotheca closterium TaxID=2856 RepID=A0AAD2G692_9STRA|nr:unnamed protein product [Cylindrotheca closterium]